MVQLPVWNIAWTSKWRTFWKFWNILDRFILTSDMNRQKLCQKKYFWCWWRHWWRHSVTSKMASYIHVSMNLSYFPRYRLQFLTNQHETKSTSVVWSMTSAYTFYGSKIKKLGHLVKKYVKFWNRHNSVILWARTSTKAQMAYLDVVISFQHNFWFRRSPGPQNWNHFENFEIF